MICLHRKQTLSKFFRFYISLYPHFVSLYFKSNKRTLLYFLYFYSVYKINMKIQFLFFKRPSTSADGPRSLPRRGLKSRLLQFASNNGYAMNQRTKIAYLTESIFNIYRPLLEYILYRTSQYLLNEYWKAVRRCCFIFFSVYLIF